MIDNDDKEISGEATLSPAASVWWERYDGDPKEYFIVQAEGNVTRLTQKEVKYLLDLFEREPDYLSHPFSRKFRNTAS